jgi:NAD(P)-dependent dehydrogenase (short-subunit alcohol dehydrogenase family)
VPNKSSRTWLITGADKGLGASVAKAALARGDHVAVTVLADDGRHYLSDQYPDTLLSIHLDAKDHARFDGVVERVDRHFGGIDILVNNAGYGLVALAEETTAQLYRPLFEVNFFGVVEMVRAVLPVMRRQRSGHVLNLSSLGGFGAVAGFSQYSATKFAVEGFSESLAAEVRHMGIKVTIVEPGPFRSDFAGPSLASLRSALADDYADVAARIDTYITSWHGKQPNDPEKFGPAICILVDAENPPLRLPLGVEAVQLIRDEIAKVAAEVDEWESVAYSTKFDE